MSWTKDQTVVFIDLYREEEVLYNNRISSYFKKDIRQRALERIAASISTVRPNTTVNEVKKKMNSLRTQFNREYSGLRNKPSGSQGEAGAIKLWCFDQLLFLSDSVEKRASYRNVPNSPENDYSYEYSHIEEGDCAADTSDSSSFPIHEITQKKRKRKEKTTVQDNIIKNMNKAIEQIIKPKNQWEAFGSFVGTELLSLKSDKYRKEAKRLITHILLDIQEKEDEENDGAD